MRCGDESATYMIHVERNEICRERKKDRRERSIVSIGIDTRLASLAAPVDKLLHVFFQCSRNVLNQKDSKA